MVCGVRSAVSVMVVMSGGVSGEITATVVV